MHHPAIDLYTQIVIIIRVFKKKKFGRETFGLKPLPDLIDSFYLPLPVVLCFLVIAFQEDRLIHRHQEGFVIDHPYFLEIHIRKEPLLDLLRKFYHLFYYYHFLTHTQKKKKIKKTLSIALQNSFIVINPSSFISNCLKKSKKEIFFKNNACLKSLKITSAFCSLTAFVGYIFALMEFFSK